MNYRTQRKHLQRKKLGHFQAQSQSRQLPQYRRKAGLAGRATPRSL